MKEVKKQLFGAKVKHIRTQKGVSLEDFAKVSGIDLDTIEAIENSEIVDFSFRFMLVFSELFDIEIEELVKDTEQMELVELTKKLKRQPTEEEITDLINQFKNL